MDMYNEQREKIGTKSITQGAGQQRLDGTRGNLVTMNFAPKPQPITQQQPQQQVVSNNPNNGYYQAPQVSLQEPSYNPNLSRIIRNIATLKNASRTQDYDKLNATLYDNMQNRNQKQSQFVSELAEKQRQYNQNYDMNNQQLERTHDLNMQKQIDENRYRQQQYNTTKPSDMKTRAELFDDMAQGHYGDTYSDFDVNTIAKARNYYMQNGDFPSINPRVEDGLLWDSTTYDVGATPTQQVQQQTQSNPNMQPPNQTEAENFKRWKAMREARAKHEAIMNRNENYNNQGYRSDML